MKLFAETLIVTEAKNNVRESDNFARTIPPYFTFYYMIVKHPMNKEIQ